jgi:hypothetical protein
MKPAQVELSHPSYLRWSYYGFFGILYALSQTKSGIGVLVSLQSRYVCTGLINATRTIMPAIALIEESSSVIQFDFLYPFPSLDLEVKNCPLKNNNGNDLLHENMYFNQLRFAWSFKNLDKLICRLWPTQDRCKIASSPLYI